MERISETNWVLRLEKQWGNYRVILDEIPTTGRYKNEVDIPPVSRQDFKWKGRDITHTENLQPQICLAYSMSRDKDAAETEGTANQQLPQHENHAI